MGLSRRRARLIERLRSNRSRAREGAVLVEGVRGATEAIDAGADVSFAVVSNRLPGIRGGNRLEHRLSALLGAGERADGSAGVVRLDDGDLDRLSDTERGQGVLLVCAEPAARLGDVRGGGRYLVLDGVRDPGNAGTLVRAAVAFGLDGVVCLDGTVDPWSTKAVRSAAGMTFRVPVVRAEAAEVLARLAEVDVPLWIASADGEDVARRGSVASFALAVGNEGDGVRAEVAEKAAGALAVRMRGPAESLNVAMAGSILLHALTREADGVD